MYLNIQQFIEHHSPVRYVYVEWNIMQQEQD